MPTTTSTDRARDRIAKGTRPFDTYPLGRWVVYRDDETDSHAPWWVLCWGGAAEGSPGAIYDQSRWTTHTEALRVARAMAQMAGAPETIAAPGAAD